MKKVLKHIILAAVASANILPSLLVSNSVHAQNQYFSELDDPAEIWAPFEEEVTLRTVIANPTYVMWREGDSLENSPWLKAYKERFNVNVTYDWVSDDLTTQTNLAIAEGNIPDVMAVNATQLQQLKEADMIMDITELFEQYASKNIKSYMEEEPQIFDSAKFDDRLYAIPMLHYGYIDRFNYLWIRQDWKNELGLEDPKTIDDMLNIARKFAENYGGYGIAEDQHLRTLFTLARSYGAYPGTWLKQDDGSIVFGTIQPEMKKFLEIYASWYQEGLINPEFMIHDTDRMMQENITGQTGVIPAGQWWAYLAGIDVARNLGKDALFFPYEQPSATDEPVIHIINNPNSGYIVINKNTKNPEAVLKLINFFAYMIDDAHKYETLEFSNELFSDAYAPALANPFVVINPQTDFNLFDLVNEALTKYHNGEEVDVEALGSGIPKYEASLNFIEKDDPEGAANYLQMGRQENSAYGIASRLYDAGHWKRNALFGRNVPTLLQSGTTLQDILVEGFTQIIIGAQPIDYFDELVVQWQEAGGNQATQEVNEMYGGVEE